MYINCKTNYSFRYGTFGTEELVKAAVNHGITSLALTNINNTCDAWDFVQFCRREKIKPILGTEIRKDNRLLYILLACNNQGFAWINRFLSRHLLSHTDFPLRAEDHIFFDNSWDGFVIYPWQGKKPEDLFPNEFIGLLPTETTRLFGLDNRWQEKFVIRQPVTVQNKGYHNLHRLLRAIDQNLLLSKLPAESICSPLEYFRSPSELLQAFQQYPFVVTNTYRLMDACQIEMDFGKDKNKKTYSASMEDDRVLLGKLARDGLMMRYGARYRQALTRLEKELDIIHQLGFNAYFLITWDIIRYAQNKGYYHVGRGSGANSLVAYCLQITDVDPIELDLYFERFLNPHRTSPPDFDIDFSWTDRDDVIDYVFKRYGREQVALLGMYATFQYNAIVRELGKVFGLPKSEIDGLAEHGHYNGESRGANFEKRNSEDPIRKAILQYGRLMQHFPDHLSIHPGGMLISEKPITDYTAVHMPPKGFPTTQIDMFVADDIGLYKLDILSQRGLGHIRDSLRLIRENKKTDIDIHDVARFKKDEKVRMHIRDANTIGCFYIESPAMRHVLKKLHCEDYLTLVAASSIIRPGVGRSGMMTEYIRRFHDRSRIKYPHEGLEPLLRETYGVMVYQEDVIKVAHHWAGLDMAEADMLRRATSFKYRSKSNMPQLKEKFFANCRGFGYPDSAAEEVWRQIESFAEFSFCKAHSASFAVESYQSLFLKAYYPMEFMVAVINNFGGFYSHRNRELYYYELMRTGARVNPPCVNQSLQLTHIRGSDVHIGFIQIKGLEENLVLRIVESRQQQGVYTDLEDLINRTGVGHSQLNLLIRSGALRFTGKTKKQLLWEGDLLLKNAAKPVVGSNTLFHTTGKNFTLPQLPEYPLDDVYDQVELLGFPVCNPFVLVDQDPKNYMPARELPAHKGKTVTVLAYHITQKPVRTIRGDVMSFGTFIDSELNWIDTVHFPEAHKLMQPQAGFYQISGKVVEEFGVYSIEVNHIEKAGIKNRRNSVPL